MVLINGIGDTGFETEYVCTQCEYILNLQSLLKYITLGKENLDVYCK